MGTRILNQICTTAEKWGKMPKTVWTRTIVSFIIVVLAAAVISGKLNLSINIGSEKGNSSHATASSSK